MHGHSPRFVPRTITIARPTEAGRARAEVTSRAGALAGDVLLRHIYIPCKFYTHRVSDVYSNNVSHHMRCTVPFFILDDEEKISVRFLSRYFSRRVSRSVLCSDSWVLGPASCEVACRGRMPARSPGMVSLPQAVGSARRSSCGYLPQAAKSCASFSGSRSGPCSSAELG